MTANTTSPTNTQRVHELDDVVLITEATGSFVFAMGTAILLASNARLVPASEPTIPAALIFDLVADHGNAQVITQVVAKEKVVLGGIETITVRSEHKEITIHVAQQKPTAPGGSPLCLGHEQSGDVVALAEAFDPNQMVDPSAVHPGHRVQFIYDALRRDRPEFEHITYGMTQGNVLEGPWLQQTPNWWGKPAKDLVRDHSHSLGTQVREIIAKAEHTVDITLLYPEPTDGWFLECIGKAIGMLASKNRDISVRILIGNYPTKIADTAGLLKNIEKWAPNIKGSKLRIYAAGMMVTVASWNHSKIIAVDGRYSIVGGHNLWWGDYLCSAPVHDVSMQVEGPAALQAHRYCNRLWSHVSYWNRRAIGIYSNDYDGRTSRIGNASLTSVTPPVSQGRGSTPILAVGRTGIMDWGKGNQSDYAFVMAMQMAKQSIKLSQQDFLLVAVADPGLAGALAGAILRDVSVSIVLTTPGATSGAGAGYTTGATIEAVAITLTALTMSVAVGLRIPPERAAALLLKNLRIAPIRFSADKEWPAERANDLCGQAKVARKIANHAKVWIVDDQMFYVGSQNAYPSDNQEYGYIVEGTAETAQLLEQYWNPLWKWSAASSLALPLQGAAIDFATLDLAPSTGEDPTG
jgi:phosphatidylserine/phosphatidylglycerophosphate/cardiolipin synthase-like enzyme